MPISNHQSARLEQSAHDARINVEVAAEELTKLERTTEAQKVTKLAEIQALDERLEQARQAKALLEQEAARLTREAESARA